MLPRDCTLAFVALATLFATTNTPLARPATAPSATVVAPSLTCFASACGPEQFLRVQATDSAGDIPVDPELHAEVVELVADTLALERSEVQDYLLAPQSIPRTRQSDTPEGTFARRVQVYVLLDEAGHILPLSIAEPQPEAEPATFDPCAPLAAPPPAAQAAHFLRFTVISPEMAGMNLVQANLTNMRTNRIEASAIGRVDAAGPPARAEAMRDAWEALGRPALPPRATAPGEAEIAARPEHGPCNVRMSVAPVGFTMTYSAGGDFTEYAHPGPGATYIGVDRMAMHDPGGRGWVDVPADMAGQMMRSGPAGPGPMDMFDPGEVDESLYMARMPRYLVEALGWERMLAARVRLGMESDAAIDLDAACPDEGADCVSLRVELRDIDDVVTYAGQVIYDSQRRVVLLPLADGSEIAFSYGDLQMGRPPGW